MKDNEIVVGDLLHWKQSNSRYRYLYCWKTNKRQLYFREFSLFPTLHKIVIRARYILSREEWNNINLVFKYFIKDDQAKYQLIENIFKVEINEIRVLH